MELNLCQYSTFIIQWSALLLVSDLQLPVFSSVVTFPQYSAFTQANSAFSIIVASSKPSVFITFCVLVDAPFLKSSISLYSVRANYNIMLSLRTTACSSDDLHHNIINYALKLSRREINMQLVVVTTFTILKDTDYSYIAGRVYHTQLSFCV